MRKLLLFLLLASPALAQKTYYIDYSGGSNANDGLTKTTAWKSHPYMPNAAGCAGAPHSYSHVAGDRFIFKGAVTWPAACFKMNITLGGSSNTVRDVYTVDQTWFTGTSFVKPKFSGADGSGVAVAISILVQVTASNVTLSFLDMGGQKWDGLTGSGDNGTVLATVYVPGGHSNVTCSNCELHGWKLSTSNTSYTHSWTGMGFGSNNDIVGTTIVCDQCYIHDDENPSGYVGTCFYNMSLTNSHCFALTEGAVSYADTHDNEINCIGYGESTGGCPASGWGLVSGSGQHTNVLEIGNKSSLGGAWNNLIHDTSAGVTVFLCGAMQFYNNVMWNNLPPGGDPPIMYDAAGSTAVCSSEAAGTTYIANNTVRCDESGGSCLRFCVHTGGSGTFNVENNHWITDGSPINNGCGSGITVTQTTNKTMPIATATSQGYGISNKFAPTAATNGTVGTGTNLHTICAGNLTALCSDTEGASWYGATAVIRPTSTAWDAGAYEWPLSSGSGTPPSVAITAPSNNATVSGNTTLTATCTPTGATIASIQFALDSTNIGAVGTSSPYSVSWTTAQSSNSVHTIAVTCTDSKGLVGTTSITVTDSNSMPGCFVSNFDFSQFQSFPTQSGIFNFTFTAQPFTNNQDGVIGLSKLQPTKFDDFAAAIRFGTGGVIEAYDGTIDGYSAITSIPYSAGTIYSGSGSVNMGTGQYSIQILSPVNAALATNYLFRTTQTGITSLGFVGAKSDDSQNTVKVCNFSIPTPVVGPQGTPVPSNTFSMVVPGCVMKDGILVLQDVAIKP